MITAEPGRLVHHDHAPAIAAKRPDESDDPAYESPAQEEVEGEHPAEIGFIVGNDRGQKIQRDRREEQ